MIYEIDGQGELLECMDILMAAAEFAAEVTEHRQRVVAFYDYYDDVDPADYDGWFDEKYTQLDVLTSLTPERDYTEDELLTAYWQVSQLAMMLLTEFCTLLDVHEGRMPELIVPEQGIAIPKQELIVP